MSNYFTICFAFNYFPRKAARFTGSLWLSPSCSLSPLNARQIHAGAGVMNASRLRIRHDEVDYHRDT